MNGETGVESKLGIGSSFWFTFEAQTKETKNELNKINSNKENENNGSLRILLAEDKVVNQKVITLMLNGLGHTVTHAIHGEKALELFEKDKFDLILMDIQMPVMDGITATKKLREMHESLPPVVGLSANAFEGDKEKYMQLGLDDYITKPIKSEDFKELINRIILRK